MYIPSTVLLLYVLETTIHREGLLRVGSLPNAPTYHRGMVTWDGTAESVSRCKIHRRE